MSRKTIMPTSTSPYTEGLNRDTGMSPIATQADVEAAVTAADEVTPQTVPDSIATAIAAVKQEDTVDTITVANDTVYSLTINGTTATYTSDADATNAEITLGLVTAINLLSEPVTATDGVNEFTIEADVAGVPFTTVITAGTMTATTTTANVDGIVNDFNDLLAALRTAGILTP